MDDIQTLGYLFKIDQRRAELDIIPSEPATLAGSECPQPHQLWARKASSPPHFLPH